MNRSALASHVALLLVYLSGLYLLLFDKLLRQFGYLHWIILLAYLIVVALVLVIRQIAKKRALTLLVGIFSLLMFIAQLADAALNLPISGFKGTNGFAYLFGFGTTPLSSFGTSTAFTVFLIFNLVLALLCFAQYRKR